MPLRTRLYVWSVIFEPLLFFVIFEESSSGITGNVSRILQAAVLIGLLLRAVAFMLLKPDAIKLPHPTRPLYRYITAYFVLAVVAGVIGYLSGAYALPASYDLSLARSSFSRTLNSAAVRPLFEYVVTLYYFVYFIGFAQYFLSTRAAVEYALSRFKTVFILSFVIGVMDFALTSSGIYLLPRHIADWVMVENRFHGLAGEPRDGFLYLVLGLAMFHLDAHLKGRPLSKKWIAAIVIAALLTQSASGLVGVALFAGLYALYSLRSLTLGSLVRLATVSAVAVTLVYVTTTNSRRLMEYVRSASGLWEVLENDEELPYLMSRQNSDIYPLYDLTRKARNLELVPVVIGSGLGSSSAVNNRYYRKHSGMNNPHAQIVRSMYETGILGTYLFMMCFVFPVRRSTERLRRKQQREFILLTLLLVGCFFGHRSSAPFIYLGIFAAAFRLANEVSRPTIDLRREQARVDMSLDDRATGT